MYDSDHWWKSDNTTMLFITKSIAHKRQPTLQRTPGAVDQTLDMSKKHYAYVYLGQFVMKLMAGFAV